VRKLSLVKVKIKKLDPTFELSTFQEAHELTQPDLNDLIAKKLGKGKFPNVN
jgi:hypothetical protein